MNETTEHSENSGDETPPPKKRRLRPLPALIPVRALAPTILTILALCSGVTAIRFAAVENWRFAIIGVLVAGLFDSLDGRVARMIKGTTRFGAELDSLSDVICFGVSPALVVYFWTLHGLGGFGWAIALIYCVCCALRLARFNIADRDAAENGSKQRYFTGIPAPGSSLLLVLPILLNFATGLDIFRQPFLIGVYMIILALLMVSQIRTYSFKYIRVEREYVLPILLAVGIFFGFLTSFFWATLSVVSILYMISLPFSVWRYHRNKNITDDEDSDLTVEN